MTLIKRSVSEKYAVMARPAKSNKPPRHISGAVDHLEDGQDLLEWFKNDDYYGVEFTDHFLTRITRMTEVEMV